MTTASLSILEVLKSAAENLLLFGGPATFSRRVFRGGRLILAYHNILPDGAAPGADLSLHLPQATFAQQLEILIRQCDVVPLNAVLSGDALPRGKPRVAITFDDAYSGAVTAGVEELAKRGLPATIFVSPGFIGGHSFWWDVISWNRGEVSARGVALTDWKGQDPLVRASALKAGHGVREAPSHVCAATEDELIRAVAVSGITVGSHTWNHPNLTRLEDSDLQAELELPLTWLRERFSNVSPWLSYPYGLSDSRVGMAARSAGYQGGLLIEGGWLPPTPEDRFRLPRLNVPAGATINRFAIQLAGLLCG